MKYSDYVVIPKSVFDNVLRHYQDLMDDSAGNDETKYWQEKYDQFNIAEKPLLPLIDKAFDAGKKCEYANYFLQRFPNDTLNKENFLNQEITL